MHRRQARPIRLKSEIADLDSPPQGLSLVAPLHACQRDELGLRDAALLRVSYNTAWPRSEPVAIDLRHIAGPDADGAWLLFIPSSKTDQAGEGVHAYLSPTTMASIVRWRAKAWIERGPLIRRVALHFDGSVSRIGADPLKFPLA